MEDDKVGWATDVDVPEVVARGNLDVPLAIALKHSNAELLEIRKERVRFDRRWVLRAFAISAVLCGLLFAGLLLTGSVMPKVVTLTVLAWLVFFGTSASVFDSRWFMRTFKISMPPTYDEIDAAADLRRHAHRYGPQFAKLVETVATRDQ